MIRTSLGLILALSSVAACSSSSGSTPATTNDGGTGGDDGGTGGDGGTGEPATMSKIKHVVIVVQENHTFDNWFGAWCTAATGSNPTCTSGPSCCEAAPPTEPSGAAPVALDDAQNGRYSPNHLQDCEVDEIGGGKMDRFVVGKAGCANAQNFAVVPATSDVIKTYRDWAGTFAMGDHYFQPIAGASASNDMYFARAQYVFTDNDETADAVGGQCVTGTKLSTHTDPTVADLLIAKGGTFSVYAEGYKKAVDTAPTCGPAPADCPSGLTSYPCLFDPGDIPFEMYPSLRDKPETMRDFAQLATDIAAGQLPNLSFIKPIGYKSEHPALNDTISAGVTFVKGVFDQISNSKYASDTLVLVTYDEGGGYYDHVAPPPTSTVDNQPYGTRVPFLALGPFAKKSFISHVTMEHSSIVKFVEWNWLGGTTGQLSGRDKTVANIGSLLDPAATGTAVPEN